MIPQPMTLNQFWACPKCDSRMAMGDPARLHPPACQFGHERTEMEQITAEAYHAPREDAA